MQLLARTMVKEEAEKNKRTLPRSQGLPTNVVKQTGSYFFRKKIQKGVYLGPKRTTVQEAAQDAKLLNNALDGTKVLMDKFMKVLFHLGGRIENTGTRQTRRTLDSLGESDADENNVSEIEEYSESERNQKIYPSPDEIPESLRFAEFVLKRAGLK
jgi:hypothetical protein